MNGITPTFGLARWLACSLLLLGGGVLPLAIAGADSVEPRFAVVGEPGDVGEAEVRDSRSRLVWRRCVEGMDWLDSTCKGVPRRMDLPQAQAYALAEFKRTGVRWRLPQVPELRMLVPNERSRLDPLFFPAAPADWCWSGSTTVKSGGSFNPYNYGNIVQGRVVDDANRLGFLHGWAVHMGTGEVASDVPRHTGLLVRLVRPDL